MPRRSSTQIEMTANCDNHMQTSSGRSPFLLFILVTRFGIVSLHRQVVFYMATHKINQSALNPWANLKPNVEKKDTVKQGFLIFEMIF